MDDRGSVNEESAAVETAGTGTAADSLAPIPAEVPEAAAADYARAIAAMDTQNWVEAEAALESLALEYPAFPGPYVNLAIVYRRDGRDDEAEAALTRALELDPDHPAANNELGILLRERGEFHEAEAAYRRALSGDSDYWLAHYNLAVLLDLYLRRESEALEHYEIYQSLAPEPEDEVGFWIVDLRRRLGLPADARLARGDGP